MSHTKFEVKLRKIEGNMRARKEGPNGTLFGSFGHETRVPIGCILTKNTCLAQLFFTFVLSSLFHSSFLSLLLLWRLNIFTNHSQEVRGSACAVNSQVDWLIFVLFYFDAKQARAACSISAVVAQ